MRKYSEGVRIDHGNDKTLQAQGHLRDTESHTPDRDKLYPIGETERDQNRRRLAGESGRFSELYRVHDGSMITHDFYMRLQEERNAALLSLDRAKIEAYAVKYNVKLPDDEQAFWAGVHKARLDIFDIPEDEKTVSRQWLRENGFKDISKAEELV